MPINQLIAQGGAPQLNRIGNSLLNLGNTVRDNRLIKRDIERQDRQEQRQNRLFDLKQEQVRRQNQREDFAFSEDFQARVVSDLSSTQDPLEMERILAGAAQETQALGLDPSPFIEDIQELRTDPQRYAQGVSNARDSLIQRGILKAPATPTKLEKLIAARDHLPEGDPRRVNFENAILKESTRAKGTSLQVNPDGSISFTQGDVSGSDGLGDPNKLNKEISKEDAGQVQASREAADAAQPTVDLLNRAAEILPQISTGKFSGSETTQALISALADLGSDAAKKQAPLIEEFDSISKELGAQALQLFGGSDTEKELEVAIRTNPQLGKDEQSNKNIIDRKLRAISVLQQRPDFEAAWLQRNGSLVNPDAQTGEFFGKAWRRFQKESAPELFEGQSDGELGDLLQFMTEEERKLFE